MGDGVRTMAELKRITVQFIKLDTVTTDLIHEVILERPIPSE
ncbi:hypothetical protein [Cryobacterium sp. Y29]|nr:hypothetical protein [Cryobacterium sp. Y29]